MILCHFETIRGFFAILPYPPSSCLTSTPQSRRMVICFLFYFFCVVASFFTPTAPSDHDFELVYRSASITNYARQFLSHVWVDKLTVCSWVHMPDIGTSQQMAVWSLRTEQNGNKNSLTALIDGNHGFYLSWDTQW